MHPMPKLPSRYNLEAFKPTDGGAIIMVHLIENSVTPWATYFMDTDNGCCVSGHYFGECDAAHIDFLGRR